MSQPPCKVVVFRTVEHMVQPNIQDRLTMIADSGGTVVSVATVSTVGWVDSMVLVTIVYHD